MPKVKAEEILYIRSMGNVGEIELNEDVLVAIAKALVEVGDGSSN